MGADRLRQPQTAVGGTGFQNLYELLAVGVVLTLDVQLNPGLLGQEGEGPVLESQALRDPDPQHLGQPAQVLLIGQGLGRPAGQL